MIYQRTETKNFDLDTAITELFGKCCDVVKVCNWHTSGTIEVNGKAYDWFMKVDHFKFLEA